MCAVSVSAGDDVYCREIIECGKARTVGVKPEHRATAAVATEFGCSIQNTVRQNQFGLRTGAVAVGPKRAGREAKRMQDRKGRAISVDFEYRAVTGGAALRRSSV